MGVPVGDANGSHVALLKCGDCGAYYETDETMGNECPDCHAVQYEILAGAQGQIDDWREDPEAFDEVFGR